MSSVESRQQRGLLQAPQNTTEVSLLPAGVLPHSTTVSNSRFSVLTPLLRLFREIKVDVREEHKHDIVHQLELDRGLIQAARRADLKGLKSCLANGADPNAQPGPDGSALHASAALGHSKVVLLLLENGAACNARGPREVTALQLASAEGHHDVVKILLKAGADINTLSSSHGTALIAATFRGHLDVVRCLLKHRADVNIKAGQYGNALQTAVVIGRLAIARVLLDGGASVRARGKDDCTALQAACKAGHAKVVRLLLDRGADINARGGRLGSALQAASNFDVFEILRDYGADVSILTPAQPGEHQQLDAKAQNNSDMNQSSVPTENQAIASDPLMANTPSRGPGNHSYGVINISGNGRAILGNITRNM